MAENDGDYTTFDTSHGLFQGSDYAIKLTRDFEKPITDMGAVTRLGEAAGNAAGEILGDLFPDSPVLDYANGVSGLAKSNGGLGLKDLGVQTLKGAGSYLSGGKASLTLDLWKTKTTSVDLVGELKPVGKFSPAVQEWGVFLKVKTVF